MSSNRLKMLVGRHEGASAAAQVESAPGMVVVVI